MSKEQAPLFTALLAAQKEIKHAHKDSKNPHFKNDYASLESVLDAVKPILNKHGLVLTQEVFFTPQAPDSIGVATKITHAETGESTNDSMLLPLTKKDPQGVGSAITYGRRYGLQAMTGIASDDDDGEAAAQPAPKQEKAGSAERVEHADPADVAKIQQKLAGALGFKPSK